MTNDGVLNERQLVAALDGQKVGKLTPNLHYFMERLFGILYLDEDIHCQRVDNYLKPDIKVTHHDSSALVSVKCGRSTTLNTESIRTFIQFLRELGISENTLKTIVYFQFGDGTLDGSGKTRKGYHDVYQWLRVRIKEANIELNSPEIIKKVVERVVFQGVDKEAPAATHVYFGTTSYGVTVSYSQMMTYLSRKKWNFIENLHIGPILLIPHARYVNREIVSEKRRNQIICYWPNYCSDLEYIAKRYG